MSHRFSKFSTLGVLVLVLFGLAFAVDWVPPTLAQPPTPIVLEPIADSYVRSDGWADDNFGCDPLMSVGSRYGYDPWYGLIQFDLSAYTGKTLGSAKLRLTIIDYWLGTADTVHRVEVHRLLPTPGRTPWIEGIGIPDTSIMPVGVCVFSDNTGGVSWVTKTKTHVSPPAQMIQYPDFDPTAAAFTLVPRPLYPRLAVVEIDITALTQGWISGAYENYGLLVSDPTAMGSPRTISFGARDGVLRNIMRPGTPGGVPVPGPKLALEFLNTAPDAQDDAFVMDEDTMLNVPAPGVLLNDLDSESDPLTVSLITGTNYGALNLNPDGSFGYLPNPNFYGMDGFTYQICDPGGLCDSAAVTIMVNAVNDPPILTVDQVAVMVNEGQLAVNSGSVSDVDGDSVLLTAVPFGAVTDSSGLWAWSYLTSDGPSQSGLISIYANDQHGGTAMVSFDLTVVNLAPVVNVGADVNVYRGMPVSLVGTWFDPAGAADNPYGWSWDYNSDGVMDIVGSGAYGTTASLTTTYTIEGLYAVTLYVTDKDGALASDTLTVNVVNQPPVCSGVRPGVEFLWPVQHQMVPVAILGVTDPEGDLITLTVTSIFQDEPTNGVADGDTSPDGIGVGTSTVAVRAERAGISNGRVYHIGFTADDGHGGLCSGVVNVGVRHDQGKKGEAVDDGPLYDSTLP